MPMIPNSFRALLPVTLVLTLAIGSTPSPALATEAASKSSAQTPSFNSGIPLFAADDILPMEFVLPFETLKESQKGDPALAGSIAYSVGASPERIPVEFAARGSNRRESCAEFPPFKAILDKYNKGRLFAGSDRDLKFVTPCRLAPNDEAFERVIEEYVLYKMIEPAGLPSLKVRLIAGVFIDSDGHEVTRGPGFFIENHKDAFLRRGYSADQIPEPEDLLLARLKIAELLVRNIDFSAHLNGEGHNVKQMLNAKGKILDYLPYDLDRSDYVGEAAVPSQVHEWDDEGRIEKLAQENHYALEVLEGVMAHASDIEAAILRSPLRERGKQKFHSNFSQFHLAALQLLTRFKAECSKAIDPSYSEAIGH